MLEPATNLILIGARASGKTSLGKKLAETLGREFVDLDELLAQRATRSADELIAERGESAFRELEAEVLGEAARLRGHVVATGGGAVLHPERFARLATTGHVIYLVASPALLLERQRRTPRAALLDAPLEDEIRQLLAEREPLYAERADITVSVDVEDPILFILRHLGEG